MSSAFPEIYLVRHGETEWSLSGRHTGRSDIPLTANGEAAARKLADRLAGLSFSAVWSSPSERARKTCALAGFGWGAVMKDDLAEWDYGAYEGITTKAILADRPGGSSFATVARRASSPPMSAPAQTPSSMRFAKRPAPS